jgi:hypothetical protein
MMPRADLVGLTAKKRTHRGITDGALGWIEYSLQSSRRQAFTSRGSPWNESKSLTTTPSEGSSYNLAVESVSEDWVDCWSHMLSLKLGTRSLSKLPASAFPDRADVYVCDKCGRDITKHFRPGQAHVWAPMGDERHRCLCGKTYLTGATEWDHFGDWERNRRIRDTLGLGALFSVMSSIPGLLAYLVVRFVFGLREGALVVGLIIAFLPFSLMQIGFWPGVVASMWRTRIGTAFPLLETE